MYLQVHDELLIEAYEEELEAVKADPERRDGTGCSRSMCRLSVDMHTGNKLVRSESKRCRNMKSHRNYRWCRLLVRAQVLEYLHDKIHGNDYYKSDEIGTKSCRNQGTECFEQIVAVILAKRS